MVVKGLDNFLTVLANSQSLLSRSIGRFYKNRSAEYFNNAIRPALRTLFALPYRQFSILYMSLIKCSFGFGEIRTDILATCWQGLERKQHSGRKIVRCGGLFGEIGEMPRLRPQHLV